MLKWLLIALLIIWLLAKTPLAKWLKLGRLPGDIDIPLSRTNKAKRLHLPLTSTLLFFAVLWLLSRVKI